MKTGSSSEPSNKTRQRDETTALNFGHHRVAPAASPHLPAMTIAQLSTIICLLLVGQAVDRVLGALFTTNAQYLQATCDSARLIRCQQDVIREMQTVSLNSASVQYPISSGPPYSPKQQAQLLVNPSVCRLVRSNLDCLLVNTPACYEQGMQTAQNTDIILRAKRFLEQNGCNEPDTTWQSTFCFGSPEIRSCEERYGFTTSYSTNNLWANNNASICLTYQKFKYCVESHIRLNCKVHEMDMANEYLIDRASDLAWRCPANISASSLSNPYQLSNQQASVLSPYNNFATYEQRPLPTYVGGGSNSVSLFGSVRDQPWERFRQPLDEIPRYGISRYPSSSGTGEVFDRLVAANAFDPDSSDCPIKAAPYARACEDTMLDQQRQARDSRDGNELQRRICCSLFQYRDCISRVVLDRCADSSPTAVEILMGVRRREMTITCRGFNRDLCSGSLATAVLNLPLLLTLAILASILTSKQSKFFLI